jgi:hypothetical protein
MVLLRGFCPFSSEEERTEDKEQLVAHIGVADIEIIAYIFVE